MTDADREQRLRQIADADAFTALLLKLTRFCTLHTITPRKVEFAPPFLQRVDVELAEDDFRRAFAGQNVERALGGYQRYDRLFARPAEFEGVTFFCWVALGVSPGLEVERLPHLLPRR